MRGKQAFSFYARKSGKSIRLVLKDTPELTKEERQEKLMNGDFHELFYVKETTVTLPENARIFNSHLCTKCGERTAENNIHIHNEEYLCDDCYPCYSRVLL